MKLIKCRKPAPPIEVDAEVLPVIVNGRTIRTWRKIVGAHGECDYYEHDETRDVWFKLVNDVRK